MKVFFVMLGMVLILSAGCGTESKAKDFVSLTPEEEARQALDAKNFAEALEKYKALVETEPLRFERYPLLATAYAGVAGFDILEAVQETLNGDASDSLLDRLGSFLPADPSPEQLEAMRLAKQTILAIPPEQRNAGSSAGDYGAAARFLLPFYQSAYALLAIKRFTGVNSDGGINPNRLESMSEADALLILETFEAVAAAGGSGLPAGASAVLAKVEAQEGASRRDKLVSYLSQSR